MREAQGGGCIPADRSPYQLLCHETLISASHFSYYSCRWIVICFFRFSYHFRALVILICASSWLFDFCRLWKTFFTNNLEPQLRLRSDRGLCDPRKPLVRRCACCLQKALILPSDRLQIILSLQCVHSNECCCSLCAVLRALCSQLCAAVCCSVLCAVLCAVCLYVRQTPISWKYSTCTYSVGNRSTNES